MEELKQCARCHSIILLKYFDKNRKGEYFKTCDNCRKVDKIRKEENRDEINELINNSDNGKYRYGKIYRISDNDNNECYIGSTCKYYLSSRMSMHRSKFKAYKEGEYGFCTVFKLFEQYGVEGCKIELIEEYPCQSNAELLKRECEHIKANTCVNKFMPARTRKEYVEDNKDKIAECQRKYREENKELISERSKQYREKFKEKLMENKKEYYSNNIEYFKAYHQEHYVINKDAIISYQKAYRAENDDKIKARKSRIEKCICGSEITHDRMSSHMKTKKHLERMQQQQKTSP